METTLHIGGPYSRQYMPGVQECYRESIRQAGPHFRFVVAIHEDTSPAAATEMFWDEWDKEMSDGTVAAGLLGNDDRGTRSLDAQPAV